MNHLWQGARAGISRGWTELASVAVLVWFLRTTASAGHWTLLLGPALIALGLTLNFIAICANGGRMPVRTPHADLGDAHVPMNPHTRLRFLGDWIDLRHWLISPGDVCLYTGLVVAVTAKLCGHLLAPQG